MGNIFKAMSEITAEISAVAKNLEVGFGSSRYKAVGEADILAAVKPIEAKHGVYSYPVSREIIEAGTMEKETKSGKTVQLFMRIKVVYRFVLIEDPVQYIDIVSYGDGVDTQDKAPGKAMTYADKYALMKAYKIITGDDPDQIHSEPQDKVKPAYPARAEMEKYIEEHYDKDNLARMLGYFKAKALADLTLEQIIVAYNRKKAAE